MWSTSVYHPSIIHLHSADPYLLVIITLVSRWWLQFKVDHFRYFQGEKQPPPRTDWFLSLIGDCLPDDFFFCSSPSLDLSCDEFHYQSVAGEHYEMSGKIIVDTCRYIDLQSCYPQSLTKSVKKKTLRTLVWHANSLPLGNYTLSLNSAKP